MNAIVSSFKPAASVPSPLLHVDVARTLDDLMQVMSVRTLVYLGGQECPYAEEFDGNDFAGSTHLVARSDDEPVGTLRIRWFAGFAKFERAAVRTDRRGGGVGQALVERGFALAADKGYRRVLVHGQVRLTAHWTGTAGFKIREGRARFVFSDHEYVELERELPESPAALSLDSDPFVLIRPEGAWGQPGVLDRSSCRAAGASL